MHKKTDRKQIIVFDLSNKYCITSTLLENDGTVPSVKDEYSPIDLQIYEKNGLWLTFGESKKACANYEIDDYYYFHP